MSPAPHAVRPPGAGRRSRRAVPRRGLTLVETLTAVVVTTVAGSALLTALGASVNAHTNVARGAVAAGLADDLAAEVFARPVRNPDERADAPGPRSGFDDVDDYRNWTERPPVEADGRPYGARPGAVDDQMRPAPRLLARYGRAVDVQQVEPDGSGGWRVAGGPTEHRRVTVTVLFDRNAGRPGGVVELARRTGVLTRVEPAP